MQTSDEKLILVCYQDFVRAWSEVCFNDVRRFRPEFFLAWLTVMGRNKSVSPLSVARDLYRKRRASLTGVDTELLRILIDEMSRSRSEFGTSGKDVEKQG